LNPVYPGGYKGVPTSVYVPWSRAYVACCNCVEDEL
jgi:hypothetical protein